MTNEPIKKGLMDLQDSTQALELAQKTNQSSEDCLGKTLAPNSHMMEQACYKGMEGPNTNLTTCSNQEKPNKSLKKQVTTSKVQTDREHDTSEQPVCQQTLLGLLSQDLGKLNLNQARDAIFTHRPCCQGPRTILVVHEEPWRSLAR